jgi:hypothetical protein
MNRKKQKHDMTMLYEFILLVAVIVIVALLVFQINDDARDDIIVNDRISASVTNETNAWLNDTSYTLEVAGYPHFTSPVITAIWNVSAEGVYNITIETGNASVTNAGLLTNATEINGTTNVSISYTYSYTPLSEAYNGTTNSDEAVAKIPKSLKLLATAIIFGAVLWVILRVIPMGRGRKDELMQ